MRAAISVLLLILPAMAQNPWRVVTINVPGAIETQVRGVNNYGEIVVFTDHRLPFAFRECPPTLRCPPAALVASRS